jgi:hypothetical protein
MRAMSYFACGRYAKFTVYGPMVVAASGCPLGRTVSVIVACGSCANAAITLGDASTIERKLRSRLPRRLLFPTMNTVASLAGFARPSARALTITVAPASGTGRSRTTTTDGPDSATDPGAADSIDTDVAALTTVVVRSVKPMATRIRRENRCNRSPHG